MPGAPTSLVGDSFFASDPAAARSVWNKLRPMLGDLPVHMARDWVFILLKPDALVTHRARDIWHGLAGAGVQAIYVAPTLLAREADYEELYKFNLTERNSQNMLGAWWLTRRQFQLSPSIQILASVPEAIRAGRDVHAFIADLKGPSDPRRGRAGQIRHDYGASNVALNLIHSSDDGLSTLRELLLFTPAHLLPAIFGAATRCGSEHQQQMEGSFEDSLSAINPPQEELDFVPLMLSMYRRATYTAPADVLVSLRDRVDRLARAARSSPPGHERIALAQATHESIDDRGAPNDSAAGRAHQALDELLRARTSDAAVALRAVRACGVGVSEWEELALTSAAYYQLPADVLAPTHLQLPSKAGA